MIELNNLNLSFDREIFKDASITIKDGLFITIDGLSGCGKSTLLNIIMGDLKVDGLSIKYDGKELNDKELYNYFYNNIVYVDQVGSYYPNMNIKDHFDFYSKLYNIEINIEESLKRVQLENINLKDSPSVLSTGQRKRLMLLLAILTNRNMLIVDEPTASLDEKSTSIILKLLREYSDLNHTVLCSTHDNKVIDISDIVYEIKDRKINLLKDNNKEINIIENNNNIPKINYSKYKNKKLKILRNFILIFQVVCLILLPFTVSTQFYYQYSSNENTKSYDSIDLILNKVLDDRLYVFDMDTNNSDNISDEELEKIKKIDGVKSIYPYYCIYLSLSDIHIYLTDSKGNKKTYLNKYYQDDLEFNTNITLLSYNDDQNIKHNNKKLDGIYISEEFKNIFPENISNSTLTLQTLFPSKMKLIKKDVSSTEIDDEGNEKSITYHNVNMYEIESKDIELSLDISDYILQDEYNAFPVYQDEDIGDEFCIYVSLSKMEELVKKYSDKESPYYTRYYAINCDNDKKSEIKEEIEKINSKYHILNQCSSVEDIKGFDNVQITRQAVILALISIILVITTLLLHLYNISLRKKEITLLRHQGLYDKIHNYYIKDYIQNIIISIIVSFIVMGIVAYYTSAFLKMSVLTTAWISSIIILFIIFYIVDLLLVNKILVRGRSNDKDR